MSSRKFFFFEFERHDTRRYEGHSYLDSLGLSTCIMSDTMDGLLWHAIRDAKSRSVFDLISFLSFPILVPVLA